MEKKLKRETNENVSFNGGNSAVVLIEFQKQWTNKGLYNWLIKGQLRSRNVMENSISFVKGAREKGVKIIHAPLIIDPKNKKGWLAYLTFGKVFTKGKEKSEITKGVFESEDTIVSGRYAFDAFIGSDLERLLVDNRIENVFFCGFTSDQCIAKSMRTALKKGFNAIFVSDCTATMSGIFQKKTEKSFDGRVFLHKKILDMIK